ncbi:hypothetical protein [Cryobacterium sp. Hz9]|uniref:hypothetical protein n=1 Tax=Cryobacterium sp. Hz9 TaxID=1259167 RepID=UPI00106D5A3C|nr:hypothetical protein [Cryobacterium sp. Hz9]TFB68424.1 hypothetical protein E3N85_05090 [Cryobacterium sp. Hz9]
MTSTAPDQPNESVTVSAPTEEPTAHIARPYRALERELERAVRDRVEVTLRVTAAVNAMRDGGCSWADIARILGTAPQTAHKKYSKPRAPRESNDA